MALSSLIGALCLGWTITLYGRRYAGASGIYEYIALAHGKSLGAFPAGLTASMVLVAGLPLLFLLFDLLVPAFATAHLGFRPRLVGPALAASVVVDPRVIPLGSQVFIGGEGTRDAIDTGGLIRGTGSTSGEPRPASAGPSDDRCGPSSPCSSPPV